MFARYLIAAYAILFSALVSASASAQNRPQDYHGRLNAACGREINSQCQGVPDQRDQLLACLYGHRSTLSQKCEGVVLVTIQRLAAALRRTEVPRVCDRDIRQTCQMLKLVAATSSLATWLLSKQFQLNAKTRFTVSGTGKHIAVRNVSS
jgi:hypothetical protein